MSGPARSCRLDNLVRRLAAFTATVANISTSIRTIISVLAFLTSSLVIPIAVITTKKVSPRRLCKIYQPGQEFQRNTTVTTCHDICTTGQQALVTSSSHTSDGRQRRGVHPWGSGYGRVLMLRSIAETCIRTMRANVMIGTAAVFTNSGMTGVDGLKLAAIQAQ